MNSENICFTHIEHCQRLLNMRRMLEKGKMMQDLDGKVRSYFWKIFSNEDQDSLQHRNMTENYFKSLE